MIFDVHQSGRPDAALLARLLREPWFALAPPKSTGRDQFHLGWLDSHLNGESSPDVQASLLELSARTIADALNATQPDTQRLIVCGGGVHNSVLISALARNLPQTRVESSSAHGLDPDFVEAMAGRPGNLPSVSGARGPRVLGAIYPA